MNFLEIQCQTLLSFFDPFASSGIKYCLHVQLNERGNDRGWRGFKTSRDENKAMNAVKIQQSLIFIIFQRGCSRARLQRGDRHEGELQLEHSQAHPEGAAGLLQ